MRISLRALLAALLLIVVASADRWFLDLFIPMSCAVFATLPPAILVPMFWIFAPDAYEELQDVFKAKPALAANDAAAAGAAVADSSGSGNSEVTSAPAVIKTKRGCECKLRGLLPLFTLLAC